MVRSNKEKKKRNIVMILILRCTLSSWGKINCSKMHSFYLQNFHHSLTSPWNEFCFTEVCTNIDKLMRSSKFQNLGQRQSKKAKDYITDPRGVNSINYSIIWAATISIGGRVVLFFSCKTRKQKPSMLSSYCRGLCFCLNRNVDNM